VRTRHRGCIPGLGLERLGDLRLYPDWSNTSFDALAPLATGTATARTITAAPSPAANTPSRPRRAA
jgi:hypothetical protein